MDTLLIDFGVNSYKVGVSMDSVTKVFGLKDHVLSLRSRVRRVQGGVEVVEEGPLRLTDVLTAPKTPLPRGFLVSQHMDFDMKKDNFYKKTFEIFFEKAGFERGQAWLQPFLSFFACRHLVDRNMLLVDSGEDSTYFIPFSDDCMIRDSIVRSPLSGSTLTNHFRSFLGRQGFREPPSQSPLDIQFLKEDSLEVCPNYHRFQEPIIENENFYWRKVSLPDGQSVVLKKEVFEIPEILFRPSDFGLGGHGLPQKLFNSIKVGSPEHSPRPPHRTHEQNRIRRR